MKSFPTLYQKTNTGAIQEWRIFSYPEDGVGVITTVFGQVDGKMQTTSDVIHEGKNLGKKSATTAVEQAEKEAQAKWEKQKKKGYVESIEAAQNDEVDSSVVMGGIEPMLAPNKSYPKDGDLQKRITYPCYVQPKLDGIRCIATIVNGKCTLWSRSRKAIPTVPHVVAALEEKFPTGSVTFDGELYSHEYRNTFEDLISILRKDAPDAEGLYKVVEYHIYDCFSMEVPGLVDVKPSDPFEHRLRALGIFWTDEPGPLKGVRTMMCTRLEDVDAFYNTCVEQEYEGAMARNAKAPYEAGKRSIHLQKMKPFLDGEFKILGIEDGRGKDAGTAAVFCCITPEGKPFKARLKATYARRRELFNNHSLWEGKRLTVTYKRLTQDGVPYLPVAKTIRDYE